MDNHRLWCDIFTDSSGLISLIYFWKFSMLILNIDNTIVVPQISFIIYTHCRIGISDVLFVAFRIADAKSWVSHGKEQIWMVIPIVFVEFDWVHRDPLVFFLALKFACFRSVAKWVQLVVFHSLHLGSILYYATLQDQISVFLKLELNEQSMTLFQ